MAQNTDSDGETEMLFSGQKTDGGLSGRFENTAVVAGTVISLAWLAFVADYVVSSGWWAARLDMTPAEFSGFAAGILSLQIRRPPEPEGTGCADGTEARCFRIWFQPPLWGLFCINDLRSGI